MQSHLAWVWAFCGDFESLSLRLTTSATWKKKKTCWWIGSVSNPGNVCKKKIILESLSQSSPKLTQSCCWKLECRLWRRLLLEKGRTLDFGSQSCQKLCRWCITASISWKTQHTYSLTWSKFTLDNRITEKYHFFSGEILRHLVKKKHHFGIRKKKPLPEINKGKNSS